MILTCSVTYQWTFSASHGGWPYINDHFKTRKHKLASKVSLQLGEVSNFFLKLIPKKLILR